jgi:hypothetical protein
MQDCPTPYAAHEYKAVAAVTAKTARTLVRAMINLCCRMLADIAPPFVTWPKHFSSAI